MIQQSHFSTAGQWKRRYQQDTYASMVTAALFTKTQTQKQSKCPPTNEQIQMWCKYTRKQYSVLRKKAILPFVKTWIGLEGLKPSDTSLSRTDTVWRHLHTASSKKAKHLREWKVAAKGLGGRGETGKRVNAKWNCFPIYQWQTFGIWNSTQRTVSINTKKDRQTDRLTDLGLHLT